MPIDDETLMALADGEIDDDKAEALHVRIKADPDLAARYALFSQTAAWVAAAALSDPEAKVSEALTARVRAMAAAAPPAAENVVALRRPASRWQPMVAAASVALAVGLSAGLFLSPNAPQTGAPQTGAPQTGAPQTGMPVLSAALQDQLGILPSGSQAALPDGRRVHVIASFTDGAGAFCREYETAAKDAPGLVSVACREGADWSLRFAMATPAASDGYAHAASLEALDTFYAATGASQPLSAEAELAYLK